ncbi:hypothetical protein KI387_019982, partial [Taxus chinensis]
LCVKRIYFFFQYAYSAENGSFTKISASGNARLQQSFRTQNSPDRTTEVSLKILIDALIDLEETLSKEAIPTSWTYIRSTWIANVKQCKTVQSIREGLLHLVESLQLIRENDGKNKSNHVTAWKKAVLMDSSPESLIQNLEHLKIFVQHRRGSTRKKRRPRRYRSEIANNKDDVCEEVDDSEKNGGRIKEGGMYEMNHKFLPSSVVRDLGSVLLTLKWGLRRKVKMNRKRRSFTFMAAKTTSTVLIPTQLQPPPPSTPIPLEYSSHKRDSTTLA